MYFSGMFVTFWESLEISPEISYLAKNDFCDLIWLRMTKKSEIKVLFWRFLLFLGLINMFTAKQYSEARPFIDLSKHTFQS